MTLRVTAGRLSVTVQGDAVARTEETLERLTYDGVPAALMAGNASLWGPDAAGRAAGRLGWVDAPETSRRLLPELSEAAGRFAGLDRVVLAGTGGAAHAAEVVARAHGTDLTVLDGADPQEVRRVLDDRLDRTGLVVSSKSGRAVEIDALRRIFEQAFRAAGIDPAERIVVVTDPGSPLEAAAKEAGHRVVLSDPEVNGRFAALSAAGLLPAALCGVDVERLLEEATAVLPALRLPYDNAGLTLGAALGAAASRGRDKLIISDGGSGVPGLGGWVEQLVAAATGKDGKGILPVVLEDPAAPGAGAADDRLSLILGGRSRDTGLAVTGPLGAQIALWQFGVAVAARVIGVDPFDEPALRETRAAVAALLRGSEDGATPLPIAGEPVLVDGEVEVHGPAELFHGAGDLRGALGAVIRAVPERGHLAVAAHLDRVADAAAGRMRPLLARRLRTAPVTFGWGGRVLHSTGQALKDGPPGAVVLQLTGAADEDVPVPGRPYGLSALQLAQAFGDLRALRSRGRTAVRLHLRDRAAGLARLESALAD
ncbi:glucose-6-phosphate isomerase [Actinoallomurus rhizosphaericola]|uniref:glucose-6-phosphate isomerase n=1 Tax=Actinoallomurus rhizosphaericola TaxID=2952536 RepID=UPI002092F3B7|nr:glucose-6-phosphate isomerase [Actinoallomurus rhizosphaericola]MCO5999366.1 glucose-6-phosphate isomerase [Actinoallomurus rhizosphaericola]